MKPSPRVDVLRADPDSPQALVVAEQPEVRAVLHRLLAGRGYHVAATASGCEALERLGEQHPDLMLLDVGSRSADGVEVLAQALETDPDLGVIMLLREGDPASAEDCLARGAMDCVVAPTDVGALDLELQRPLRWWDRLVRERQRWRQTTQAQSLQSDDLKEAIERQERFTVATLEALVNAREARNPYLAGHSPRVAGLASKTASHLGLAPPEAERVRRAGRLHDLGMIGVRDGVVNKPTSLSEEEYEHVKRHSSLGAWILAPLTHLGSVVDFVRSHHERLDGRGYPDGLAGTEIPLGARILHAAEVFDALTTDRPYQEPVGIEEAVRRMRALAEQSLDQAVVEALADAATAPQADAAGWDAILSDTPDRERAPLTP